MAFDGKFLVQIENVPDHLAPGADVLEIEFFACPDGNLQPESIVYYDVFPGFELELTITGPPMFKKGWEVVCTCRDTESLGSFLAHNVNRGAVEGKRWKFENPNPTALCLE